MWFTSRYTFALFTITPTLVSLRGQLHKKTKQKKKLKTKLNSFIEQFLHLWKENHKWLRIFFLLDNAAPICSCGFVFTLYRPNSVIKGKVECGNPKGFRRKCQTLVQMSRQAFVGAESANFPAALATATISLQMLSHWKAKKDLDLLVPSA